MSCGVGGNAVKMRLDELCELNMGQSPNSSSYKDNGNGIPFFREMQTLAYFTLLYEFAVMNQKNCT